VIEEAILGDSDRALFENGGFGHIQNAVSRIAAFAVLKLMHGVVPESTFPT
jgi:hypothetical protein